LTAGLGELAVVRAVAEAARQARIHASFAVAFLVSFFFAFAPTIYTWLCAHKHWYFWMMTRKARGARPGTAPRTQVIRGFFVFTAFKWRLIASVDRRVAKSVSPRLVAHRIHRPPGNLAGRGPAAARWGFSDLAAHWPAVAVPKRRGEFSRQHGFLIGKPRVGASPSIHPRHPTRLQPPCWTEARAQVRYE